MKTVTLIAMLAATLCALGQNPPSGNPANIAGTLYASNFAGWNVPMGNNGPLNWSYASACNSATSGGVTFAPFVVGSPVRIVDNNPSLSETVTVTAVRPSGSGCQIAVSPSNPHDSFTIRTATAGLQEAINSSSGRQSVVVVTPDFVALGGTNSTITNAKGSTNVSILDLRTSPAGAYTWNSGTQMYVASSIVGGVSRLLAGANILLSPTDGTGDVTIASTGGSSFTMNYKGLYSSSISYATNDVIADASGHKWISLASANLNNTPAENSFWTAIAGPVTTLATHPTLGDACFQVSGTLIISADGWLSFCIGGVYAAPTLLH